MFYEPTKRDQRLAKNPFSSLIVPRPIGWISSRAADGVVNLAPYSFFNAVCYHPPTVMFSSGSSTGGDGKKDSLRNIEATGEFVCNLVTWETCEQMNQTAASVPPETDEMNLAGLTPIPSKLVGVPRVAEAPVHLECRFVKRVDIPNSMGKDRYVMVLGEVVGIHIQDDLITDEGLVDVAKMRPVGRLGYNDYTQIDDNSLFSIKRPD